MLLDFLLPWPHIGTEKCCYFTFLAYLFLDLLEGQPLSFTVSCGARVKASYTKVRKGKIPDSKDKLVNMLRKAGKKQTQLCLSSYK